MFAQVPLERDGEEGEADWIFPWYVLPRLPAKVDELY